MIQKNLTPIEQIIILFLQKKKQITKLDFRQLGYIIFKTTTIIGSIG